MPNLDKPADNGLSPFANYHPPQSTLANSTQPFYVVSIKKFWLLFMLTFSLYLFYWFYRQWKAWKVATGEKVYPILGGIFWVFMAWGLISRIFERAKQVDDSVNRRKIEQATAIAVLGGVANRILDKVTSKDDFTLTYLGLTLLFFFITGWGITRLQHYINIACRDPQGLQNNKFTGANYAWMVLGSLLWLAGIFSVVAPFLGIEI